jgi:hypothetical protein
VRQPVVPQSWQAGRQAGLHEEVFVGEQLLRERTRVRRSCRVCHSSPQRHWSDTVCAATSGSPSAASAPGLTGLTPAHICTGTGLAAATSAPRLGLSCPHLHRDCAHLGLGSHLSECVRPSERTLLRCARRCNSPRHDATCYTGVACRSTAGLCTPCDSFVDMRVTRNLSRRTRTLGIIHSAMAAAYSSITPSRRRRRAAVHAHACDGTRHLWLGSACAAVPVEACVPPGQPRPGIIQWDIRRNPGGQWRRRGGPDALFLVARTLCAERVQAVVVARHILLHLSALRPIVRHHTQPSSASICYRCECCVTFKLC